MGLLLIDVSKSFGSFQAIKDLSMEVEEGALFGFLGPNGAGKTTAMRMILDLFRPDSGQISWNGTPVREVARRSFGYLPEERGLYPRMEVAEQPGSPVSPNRTRSAPWMSGWSGSRSAPIATRRSKNSPKATSRKCSFSPPYCTTRPS